MWYLIGRTRCCSDTILFLDILKVPGLSPGKKQTNNNTEVISLKLDSNVVSSIIMFVFVSIFFDFLTNTIKKEKQAKQETSENNSSFH